MGGFGLYNSLKKARLLGKIRFLVRHGAGAVTFISHFVFYISPRENTWGAEGRVPEGIHIFSHLFHRRHALDFEVAREKKVETVIFSWFL